LMMEPEVAAIKLQERLRGYDMIDNIQINGYPDYGRIAHEIQDGELWAYLTDKDGKPYTSFNRWVDGFCNSHATKDKKTACRSKLYEAKRYYESLLPNMTPDEMEGMSRGTMAIASKLSKEVLATDEVQRAIHSTDVQELRKMLSEKHPNQHIEKVSVKKYPFTVTQLLTVNRAIGLIKKIEPEIKSDSEAIEKIFADWLSGQDDVEEEPTPDVADEFTVPDEAPEPTTTIEAQEPYDFSETYDSVN
jgi:hypothetical protein